MSALTIFAQTFSFFSIINFKLILLAEGSIAQLRTNTWMRILFLPIEVEKKHTKNFQFISHLEFLDFVFVFKLMIGFATVAMEAMVVISSRTF